MRRAHAVIVHHHGQQMLARCLDSLLASSGVEVEAVVVENGCDEELPEVTRTSPQVHVVRSPAPLGFSEANNLGVRWARQKLGSCEAYFFVNNDTQCDPEAVARLLARLETSPETAVVGPRLQILGAPGYLNSLGLNVTRDAWGWDEGIGIHLDDYGPLPEAGPVLAVTGAALLVRAAAFAKVGGWTEIYDYYFEDIDLCLKARSKGWEVDVVPEALVLHEISATMTEGSEKKVYYFWRNRLLLAFIHWPPLLLWATLRRAVREIRARGWNDSLMQRVALAAAVKRLPKLLWLRGLGRRRRDWRHFLRPPGSVPVIELPTVASGASESVPEGAG